MPSSVLYLPDLLYAEAQSHAGVGLLVESTGAVVGLIAERDAPPDVERLYLPGKALLPGLANAHSHTFQRLFRGRAEGRAVGGDSFWTWREQMYRAAAFVSPDSLYDVARATFLEMACSGITVVGEFHYLHRDPEGRAYADPNLLSHQVIAAAQSVGLRICLLRCAYFRAGFGKPPHPGQRRFYEPAEEYLRNLEALAAQHAGAENVTVGAAPHSIRAVPLFELQRIAEAAQGKMPLHLHISEQPAENAACLAEYGATPVELLANHGILSSQATLVHAIHLTEEEFEQVASADAIICSCPTTERNLGDGIFPASRAAHLGIPIAFGTDSQAQIDILEDSRQLEYHLRLRDQQRGILDGAANSSRASQTGSPWRGGMTAGLLRAATAGGYAALGLSGGNLAPGQPADFFTVDLNDLSILGLDSESLDEQAVFALAKSAVRDVAVQGKLILRDGHHPLEEEIRSKYRKVQHQFRDASNSEGEIR